MSCKDCYSHRALPGVYFTSSGASHAEGGAFVCCVQTLAGGVSRAEGGTLSAVFRHWPVESHMWTVPLSAVCHSFLWRTKEAFWVQLPFNVKDRSWGPH